MELHDFPKILGAVKNGIAENECLEVTQYNVLQSVTGHGEAHSNCLRLLKSQVGCEVGGNVRVFMPKRCREGDHGLVIWVGFARFRF